MAIKLPFQTNVVNMIGVYFTKDTAQMTYDSVLATIINPIVANDMGTNFLLTPTNLQAMEYRFNLIMVTRFIPVFGTEHITRCYFLTDANAATFGVMDNVVFNNPALTPVGTKQSWLISRRRCPRCGSLGHFKALDCNVIDARSFWIETSWSHIDFNQLFIGIIIVEISMNGSSIL